jgi:hypothetical protein
MIKTNREERFASIMSFQGVAECVDLSHCLSIEGKKLPNFAAFWAELILFMFLAGDILIWPTVIAIVDGHKVWVDFM